MIAVLLAHTTYSVKCFHVCTPQTYQLGCAFCAFELQVCEVYSALLLYAATWETLGDVSLFDAITHLLSAARSDRHDVSQFDGRPAAMTAAIDASTGTAMPSITGYSSSTAASVQHLRRVDVSSVHPSLPGRGSGDGRR